MSDILRKELAPLTADVWEQISNEVREALTVLLSARRVVDFHGPHGYMESAVSTGRLINVQQDEGVSHGVRSVLPLTEVRVDFTLSLEELDNFHRGALDVDLAPAHDAARRLAEFEDKLVYEGMPSSGVQGIIQSIPHDSIPLGSDAAAYVSSVARAMQTLVAAGVRGPYALVLAPDVHRELVGDVSAYPPRERIAKLIEGPIVQSQRLAGGLLVSMRGGDFRLDVGQDVSIGYCRHTAQHVDLFLLETLAFRVIASEAAVRLS